jgi:hypothetical protein
MKSVAMHKKCFIIDAKQSAVTAFAVPGFPGMSNFLACHSVELESCPSFSYELEYQQSLSDSRRWGFLIFGVCFIGLPLRAKIGLALF